MDLLDNEVQPYAWGSRTAIAGLLGKPASEGPQAELWLGSHPLAPSRSLRDGRWASLAERIAADPAREVGEASAKTLPFLLKVLAAEQPLSLQAHPDLEQARAGFAREEAAGVPRDAPQRSYRDPNHKPELIVALTPFEALCGFRPLESTRALLDALAVPQLASARAILKEWPDGQGVGAVFYGLVTMPPAECGEVVAAVVEACRQHVEAKGPFAAEAGWALELGRRYPGDVGAVSSLLLNLVHLKPGEGLFLPAGNLHAYLHGVGIELMASSDNVLRGGLTTKHVDVQELISVLKYELAPVKVLTPQAEGPEAVYPVPTPELRLSRIEVKPKRPVAPARRGPELLLCVEGAVRAGGLELPKGASAFVPASDGPYTLEGEGVVFRATGR